MSSKTIEPSRNLLIVALVCICIGVVWLSYEFLRPLREDEIKDRADAARMEAEIAKQRR